MSKYVAQCPGLMRNVWGQGWPHEMTPHATIPEKDKFWTMCSEQYVLNIVQPVLKMKMKMKKL